MTVVCAHCGLPFSVGRAEPGRAMYCCSGCALASRLTVGSGGESHAMNATLATALGVGFVFFNQVLCWLLSVSLARMRADAVAGLDWATPERLAWGSLALGATVWLAQAVFWLRSGAGRRGADVVVLIASAGVIGWAAWESRAAWAVVGNAMLAAWTLRGLIRKRGV